MPHNILKGLNWNATKIYPNVSKFKLHTLSLKRAWLLKRTIQRETQYNNMSQATFTTEAKLSSKIMMSELSFATSVPEMPIDRPISA